ncbi:hypothetical protein [Spiroplasma endosymbiont of Villa modesta]|uniref:hypothetical protein n=1 Tax=Spiroplasma endosymbiont of Villa modesta TaxID=3066293 RepID=UPI00313EA7AF
MPINFENLKPYRIDYDSLFSLLNNFKIFDQKNIQESFFKKWKEELIKHDQIIIEQFYTYGKNKILELFSIHNEFENFYIPFLFSEFIIFKWT